MIIGKLYIVPFTRKLIAAIDSDDAYACARAPVTFVSDLYTENLVPQGGRLCLSKPHLGGRAVI